MIHTFRIPIICFSKFCIKGGSLLIFKDIIILIINIFVVLLLIYLFGRMLEKTKVTIIDENMKYKYRITINMSSGEVHQIMVFSNAEYSRFEDIVSRCHYMNFNKKSILYQSEINGEWKVLNRKFVENIEVKKEDPYHRKGTT